MRTFSYKQQTDSWLYIGESPVSTFFLIAKKDDPARTLATARTGFLKLHSQQDGMMMPDQQSFSLRSYHGWAEMMLWNSASSITVTPSFCAFSSFEPASAPAST